MKYSLLAATMGLTLAQFGGDDDPEYCAGCFSDDYLSVGDYPENYYAFLGVQDEIESQMNADFDYFEPVWFKQQVVAGMNYEVIYDLGSSDGFLQVFMYQGFDGTITVNEVEYIEGNHAAEGAKKGVVVGSAAAMLCAILLL